MQVFVSSFRASCNVSGVQRVERFKQKGVQFALVELLTGSEEVLASL